MSEAPTLGSGLRARKRAETARRIVEAARDLVGVHGYEHVTVDMICSESSVSAGTFFNYFGTKEGVFLGAERPMPTAEAEAVFVRGTGSVLVELHDLLAVPYLAALGDDRELMALRREVIDRVPALAGLEMARFTEAGEHFTRLVLSRFEAQGRTGAKAALLDEAHTVVELGIILGRRVLAHWSAGGDLRSVHERAQHEIALIHHITDPTPPSSSNPRRLHV